MEKEILFKSNDIIMCKTDINLKANEFKFFNKILYSCQKINDQEKRLAIVSYDEIKEIFQHSNECSIKSVTKLLESWRTASITYKTNRYESGTGLLIEWKRDIKTNEFYLYMNEDFYQILMDYKKFGYSPIDVKMVRNVKGYYSQKLYELLKVWSGTKEEVTYSIEDLKEVNEKLNMEVDYLENKKGKKVTSLTFKVKDFEPRHYEL